MTTLSPRPTLMWQLNYTELYDLEGCCSFVADFMAYEALEEPLHPPEHLPSPMSALGWQVRSHPPPPLGWQENTHPFPA